MAMTPVHSILSIATVATTDARTAADGIYRQLGPGPHAAVLVFATPRVDRRDLAAALQQFFPGVPVIGATTAGEIGGGGLRDGCVVATSLPSEHFRVVVEVVEDLRTAVVEQGRAAAQTAMRRLAAAEPRPSPANTFAMLLVDGLSVAEERLASALSSELGELRLVGGSAGDEFAFEATSVFAGGRSHDHGAVLVLVHTDLPFTVFRAQHFVPGERRMVVTKADARRRIVYELDGEPAAPYLAESMGLRVGELEAELLAIHPVVVRIGGADYVRSIQKVNLDDSLTFYCAVEEGIVLREAQTIGIVDSIERAMAEVRAAIGEPQLTIAFDCVQRRQAYGREDATAAVGAVMEAARCIGFSTYGEQFGGIHVNQTLTGVAFGRPRD
ncbi:MAG: FIST C-terminal domain-containing protein [Planctomycetes bacterium]|nr:FIST C-terminal domain-containing protein [Planctomycetota bacterium]